MSCDQLHFAVSPASKAADRCLTALTAARDHGVGTKTTQNLPWGQAASRESLPLRAGAPRPSSPPALSPWGRDGVHATFLRTLPGSSLQSPQLLSLCSHSVPDHTFGSRCARRGGRLRHSRQTPLPTCTEREQPQCQLPALRHVWGRISIFHGAQTCSCWMHREPPAADLLADSRRLCLRSAGRPVLPGGQDVAPTGQHLHSQGLLLRALRVQPRCSAPG